MFGALLTFAFVGLITPGPNNIMLVSSGTNFGIKRSIPHLLGVAIGFSLMILVVGFGIFKLFELYPFIQSILKVLCVGYLIYLSIKIMKMAPNLDASHRSRPMSFFQAVMFQWVNPKGWTLALTAITLYGGARGVSEILFISSCFGVLNLFTCFVWVSFGVQIKKLLKNDNAAKTFNIIMGLMLLSTLVFVFV